jgi:hypothetical protein
MDPAELHDLAAHEAAGFDAAGFDGATHRPSPYAGWDDERHATAIPVDPRRRSREESIYRSPDGVDGDVDRDADTGPIRYLPPHQR